MLADANDPLPRPPREARQAAPSSGIIGVPAPAVPGKEEPPPIYRPFAAFRASFVRRTPAERARRDSVASACPWTGQGHPSLQYRHFSLGTAMWARTMWPYFLRGIGCGLRPH